MVHDFGGAKLQNGASTNFFFLLKIYLINFFFFIYSQVAPLGSIPKEGDNNDNNIACYGKSMFMTWGNSSCTFVWYNENTVTEEERKPQTSKKNKRRKKTQKIGEEGKLENAEEAG